MSQRQLETLKISPCGIFASAATPLILPQLSVPNDFAHGKDLSRCAYALDIIVKSGLYLQYEEAINILIVIFVYRSHVIPIKKYTMACMFELKATCYILESLCY